MADIFDFSIRDLIFHEDDGSDIINGGDANTADTGGEENAAGDDTGEDTGDEGGDDDFDIDTSIDDEGGEEDSTGEDTGEDTGDDNLDSGGDSMDSGDGEPIPQNTDIFATLTAEEQQIKIMELKKLYNDLYTYTDDLLKKMNDLDIEEDTLEVISRTSSQLYHLKIYLRDYMTKIFDLKSFFENDVFFNRFSSIIYSIGVIVDRLVEKRRKKLGIEDDDA